MTQPGWRTIDPGGLVTETHFGRTLTCFASRPRNIGAMIGAMADRQPDSEAIVDGPTRLSYRELLAHADASAAHLMRLGLAPGDRVGVWSDNHWEALVAVVACLRAGLVAVPLGHRLQTAEVRFMLQDSGTRFLFVDSMRASRVPAREEIPSVEHVCRLGEPVDSNAPAEPGLCDPEPPGDLDEEALVLLMYTSGTTGKPKGAMITHFNLAHSVIHYIRAMHLREGDERSLLAVPFTHITGMVAQTLTMFACGGAVVLMRDFKAGVAVNVLRAERVTHSVMVPAMYNLILRSGELAQGPLPDLRIGAYGGAPMPESLIQDIHRELPDLELINAYGSTETTSPATLLPASDALVRRNSVGIPVHCAEIRVCDSDGRELPPGSVGELRIGGPMVVPGYWNRDDANSVTFADGSWKSGDIGRMDSEGYVEVLDRSKDMINRGGYKIYSAEVEGVLAQHPEVVEAAVVARPCAVLGERVHAFVTTASEAPTQPDLQQFLARQIADYKVPETMTLQLRPLPRNANGKIVKSMLREQLATHTNESPR